MDNKKETKQYILNLKQEHYYYQTKIETRHSFVLISLIWKFIRSITAILENKRKNYFIIKQKLTTKFDGTWVMTTKL